MIHHLPRFASVCAAAPSGPAARFPAADAVAGDVTSPVAAALDPRQSPVSVSMDQALTASPASSSGMVHQREPNLHVYRPVQSPSSHTLVCLAFVSFVVDWLYPVSVQAHQHCTQLFSQACPIMSCCSWKNI